MGAGCGSLGEWVRGRLDVSPETARDLVATAKHLEELPDVEEALETGEIGFDRAVAVGRFADRDDTFDILNEMAGFDIAGIRNRAARRRRMTRVDEQMVYQDRYVTVEPNLDESLWLVNGRLPGFAGKIVIDALEARADTLPKGPGQVSRAARNADALWAISLDVLYGGDGASIEDPPPVLTVFVDAREAAATNGEAGVVVQGGPRVGEAAIEAILCDGVMEVTAHTTDGTPLGIGRRSRAISPQLRRFVMDRDGAQCTIAGCTSRYRLQVHHIQRWIDGGRTDPENLTTVCWFHHQVVIHGQGFTIDPNSPPQRRRLLQPPIHGPPWLEHARTNAEWSSPKHPDTDQTQDTRHAAGLIFLILAPRPPPLRTTWSFNDCRYRSLPDQLPWLETKTRPPPPTLAPLGHPPPPSAVEAKTRVQSESRVSGLGSLLFALCSRP